MLTICIQSNLKTLLLENNDDMGIYKRLQKVSQFQHIKSSLSAKYQAYSL